MKKTHALILSSIFILCFASCAKKNGVKKTVVQNKTVSEIDSILNALYMNEQFNGGVLLAKGNEVIFKKTYGYASFEKNTQLNENTIFQTASISKTFTAVAVLQLIEKGKLSLDSKLVDFFPKLPYPDITIRQLLSHTAGLYPYNPLFVKNWDHKKIATNKDVIKMYESEKPEQFFTSGTEFSYANVGYVFLSSIVEKISGLPFDDYLKKEVLLPSNMNNTQVYTLLSEKGIDNFAEEHVLDPFTGSYKNPLNLDYHKEVYYLNGKMGDDKVASTLDDMWKWNRALFTYKVLPKTILDKAFTSSITKIPDSLRNGGFDYGFGFQLEDNEKLGKIIYHNGGEPGLRARFTYYKDHDISIILYANAQSEYITKIRNIIVNIMLEKPYEMPKKSLANELYKVANNGNEAITKVANKYRNDSTYYINENEINRLASVFWKEESYDAGFDLLKLNIDLFPESINAVYTLAEGYYETNQFSEAIIHLKRIRPMMLARPKEKQNLKYLKSIDGFIDEIAEEILK